MNFYVCSGNLQRKIFSKSPKQAALDFLLQERGPFAKVIGVHHTSFTEFDEKRDCFFWVETLLSENKASKRKVPIRIIT